MASETAKTLQIQWLITSCVAPGHESRVELTSGGWPGLLQVLTDESSLLRLPLQSSEHDHSSDENPGRTYSIQCSKPHTYRAF